MKFTSRSFIFLFFTIYIQAPSLLNGHMIPPPLENDISEITEANDLRILLTNPEPTVIIGYMHHCPYCKKLLQYFETLPAKYPRVTFCIVHGPHLKLHDEVAKFKKDKNSNFKIPGYPSIVFIKGGKPINVQIGGNEKTLDENIKKLLK